MTTKQISFINIDDTSGDYFSTSRQIQKRKIHYFTDTAIGNTLTGSNTAVNLLNRPPNVDPHVPQISRNYLSSSVDVYRSGVNVLNSKQWNSGIVKILAGTPGHIVDPLCLGVNKISILSEDTFVEIEPFKAQLYVGIQANESAIFPEDVFTFPIITSDVNQLENYTLNGIIEPIPIRSVVSNFSINVPFEPQGVRGGVGNGNIDHRLSSDQVLSVDYYEPGRPNENAFLDAGETLDIRDANGNIIVPGVTIGYFYLNPNSLSPFADEVPPRDSPVNSTYTNDLIAAIYNLSSSTSTYITRKQRSAGAGFTYDSSYPAGTDSIAFGGMGY